MPWVNGQYQSIFGSLVGRQQVEAAVLSVLGTWIGTEAAPGDYIGEIERANTLAARTIPLPPSSDSFHGGLDFDTWRQGNEPVIIVNAQPVEDSEHRGDGEWSQWYEVKVASICVADQRFYDAAAVNQKEDTARDLADLYGEAVLGVLMQQLANYNPPTWLGRVELVQTPPTEFVDPEVPTVARSVVIVRMFVHPVVDESQGPSAPSGNPYNDPGAVPDAETTNLTLITVPDTEVP